MKLLNGREESFPKVKPEFTNKDLVYRYEYELDTHGNWVERRQYDKDYNLINVIKRNITYY